jgi:hypothetical protein
VKKFGRSRCGRKCKNSLEQHRLLDFCFTCRVLIAKERVVPATCRRSAAAIHVNLFLGRKAFICGRITTFIVIADLTTATRAAATAVARFPSISYL